MPTTFRIRPQDPRSRIFRGLETILRREPELRALGCVFQTYDGSPSPSAGPDTDRPWIELTPEYPPPEPMALDPRSGPGRITYESPVLVKVRTRVQGSNSDNSINLFGLIERAIYRTATWDELRELGVNLVETAQPCATAADNETAEGVFKLTTYTAG